MYGRQRVLAIIPARGNSKGIPRKNIRNLSGQPLISYVIAACQQSRYIDDIFVSTESETIRNLVLRYGVRCVERPEELSRDEVGLDEVVCDAVPKIEATLSRTYELVVTVQPTSPLISARSIDKAIETCIRKQVDTVISVSKDNHLRWKRLPDGTAIPLFEKRVNRQFMENTYRETGAILVCRRQILEQGTRVGKRVELIEVPKQEAIDIDDYYDWWLAEKSLQRKKICFHVIGNKRYGLGHVMRALTIADRIMDHQIVFVVNERHDLAAELIRKHYYDLAVCKPGEELATILDLHPDLCINDILNTSPEFMKPLKETGITVINFEDLGEGSLYADAVINSLYDFHPHLSNGRLYHGIRYCCLRDEFLYATPKPFSETVERILILFGGTDPRNLTEKTLRWLDELEGDWSIVVILGLGYDKEKVIRDFARSARHRIELTRDPGMVSLYMQRCDLAITGAGRTVFELTALGIPMVVIASNHRELLHTFAQESYGTISLGLWNQLKKDKFQGTIRELLQSPILRMKMRNFLLESEVRQGIQNVLSIIESMLQNGHQQSETSQKFDRPQSARKIKTISVSPSTPMPDFVEID